MDGDGLVDDRGDMVDGSGDVVEGGGDVMAGGGGMVVVDDVGYQMKMSGEPEEQICLDTLDNLLLEGFLLCHSSKRDARTTGNIAQNEMPKQQENISMGRMNNIGVDGSSSSGVGGGVGPGIVPIIGLKLGFGMIRWVAVNLPAS
ncbi:hypothetical protein AMTR_s00129p00115560 [Amborella trichopoda]|uniref:Uncharacterized protein n=1 Tax=Amborella trichopoda TaxID=13333 RepID=W1NLG9_AMBTC|nr:hypothetical protein AMTR_s00129p00115560 [Amborella trichopoda]